MYVDEFDTKSVDGGASKSIEVLKENGDGRKAEKMVATE
jgi:hypothetical protein